MEMTKKVKLVYTLLLNLPITLAISLAAQMIGRGRIEAGPFLLSFLLSYLICFLLGMCLPLVPWGMRFARACKAQPGGLGFSLLITAVVNLAYVVVNTLILTFVNVVLLAHLPVTVFLLSVLRSILPIYLVGFVVAFLWNPTAQKLAHRLCGE